MEPLEPPPLDLPLTVIVSRIIITKLKPCIVGEVVKLSWCSR